MSSRYDAVAFLFDLVVFVFVSQRLSVFVCWRQELELRARDRYGALDQMNAKLHQLREQRDAFDALAEALRTRDGWLSYRAVALRDQLLELEGQATTRPSAIERIRTALIDRDEALQQARRDLERARTVATDWEARWCPSGPRTGRSARGSWMRSPSKAGSRRGRGRPSRGPRRPKS
jgi:hypothetical protein